MTLDTSYHDRQLAEKLKDPENKAKFERFLREIQQGKAAPKEPRK